MDTLSNQRPKCKREGCVNLACINSNGGFFSHCGNACRAPPCNNYSECKKTAEKNRNGPGFYRHCYGCRQLQHAPCQFAGCGSNATCVKSKSNGRFSH